MWVWINLIIFFFKQFLKKFLLVFRNKILFKNSVWSHKKPLIYWIIFLKTNFKEVFGSFEKFLKKFKIFFIFSIITQKILKTNNWKYLKTILKIIYLKKKVWKTIFLIKNLSNMFFCFKYKTCSITWKIAFFSVLNNRKLFSRLVIKEPFVSHTPSLLVGEFFLKSLIWTFDKWYPFIQSFHAWLIWNPCIFDHKKKLTGS